ncbi:MAG: type II toxin-antitoxin system HicB family antitoxin [Candidatus Amesbacteria bacterium]|nr:type II toxin-antitoxin system HicB family antitoxin [Candidatus Amesbacteria bacterium]
MKKVTVVNQYEFPIEIKKEGDDYIALCPAWSDCYAQGHSLENAVDCVTEVAKGLIEIYDQEDRKIPLKLKRQNKSDTRFRFDLSILAPAF